MSHEYLLVNPTLVQAYSDELRPEPTDRRATPYSMDSALQARLEGQIEAGANPSRFVVLNNKTSLHELSPEKYADFRIANELLARSGDSAVSYYLAETALTATHLPIDSILKAPNIFHDNRDSLVRIEEGLGSAASSVQQRISRLALTSYRKDGKLYSKLPGHDSHVPVSGWWIFPKYGDRQLLPDIPSCEMFMTATAQEQAEHADAVVRIVPSSMEDREVAVHRILELISKPIDGYSIVSAPNGDIKRLRTWGRKRPLPETIKDLVKSMKVDSKAGSIAEEISKNAKHIYAADFQKIPGKDKLHSPNRNMNYTEALSALIEKPYISLPIYEKYRPLNEEIDSVRKVIEPMIDSDTESQLHYTHHEGENTNNVAVVTFRLGRVLDIYRNQGNIISTVIMSRITNETLRNLDLLAASKLSGWEQLSELMQHPNVHYLLIEGKKKNGTR